MNYEGVVTRCLIAVAGAGVLFLAGGVANCAVSNKKPVKPTPVATAPATPTGPVKPPVVIKPLPSQPPATPTPERKLPHTGFDHASF